MSEHKKSESRPAVTYGERPPIAGPTLTCPRCKRRQAYPKPEKSVRCGCGWRYFIGPLGTLMEDFKPPMDL
jgi:hypothetical protein